MEIGLADDHYFLVARSEHMLVLIFQEVYVY
jgi:hypothetical protein